MFLYVDFFFSLFFLNSHYITVNVNRWAEFRSVYRIEINVLSNIPKRTAIKTVLHLSQVLGNLQKRQFFLFVFVIAVVFFLFFSFFFLFGGGGGGGGGVSVIKERCSEFHWIKRFYSMYTKSLQRLNY